MGLVCDLGVGLVQPMVRSPLRILSNHRVYLVAHPRPCTVRRISIAPVQIVWANLAPQFDSLFAHLSDSLLPPFPRRLVGHVGFIRCASNGANRAASMYIEGAVCLSRNWSRQSEPTTTHCTCPHGWYSWCGGGAGRSTSCSNLRRYSSHSVDLIIPSENALHTQPYWMNPRRLIPQGRL
ncbi:hypothetical protein GY45DRAFT_678139 [Cubamyces sp. BRFM 1775]|nr:hypothetical protein GY45DRAFT_678139 [Cubamyces sp. BRFM 1775]